MRGLRIALPLLAALLCACGQKGNLYRPGQAPDAVGNTSTVPAASPAPATPPAGAAGATNATAPAADAAAERERENAARNRN
jgi:predicted small lipoprotein YifL